MICENHLHASADQDLQRIVRSLRFSSDIVIRNAVARRVVEKFLVSPQLNECEGQEDITHELNEVISFNFRNTLPDRGLLTKDCLDMINTILSSESYKDVETLNEAFNKFKVTSKHNEQRKRYVTVVSDSKGIDHLYVTIPDVREASPHIKDNAAFYINFAKVMLGISDDNIHVVFDKSLGNIIKFPKSAYDAIRKLLESARSSTGLVGMRTHTLKSGFKGPLPALLCAMRLLKRSMGTHRKARKSASHLQVIRDEIESEFGFRQPGFDEFVKHFILQVLSISTSENQKFFPASFYAIAKSENGVKTSEGILASLGYISLLPSVNKITHIATRVISRNEEDGKPIKIDSVSDQTELPHNQEYQMAVKLLLPMLNKSSNVALKEQIKSPDKYLSEEARTFYKDASVHVDNLNKAYAFTSAFEKKKSKKTKISHVDNEIGKLARSASSKLTFKDSTGRTFESYMEINYSYRKFLETLLRRRRSPKKRKSSLEEIPTDNTLVAKAKKVKVKASSPGSYVRFSSLNEEGTAPKDLSMETD